MPARGLWGVWGYAEFLGDRRPEARSHDDMVEWVGGKFDPEKFSVDEVNRELRKLH